MDVYLGIDIGTTHLKVCAVRQDGCVLYTALRDQETELHPEWGDCIPAKALWERVCGCLEEVIGRVDPDNIRAFGIASMAEATVPIDRYGNSLMPAVPWNGAAWGGREENLPSSYRGLSLYKKTGLLWHPKYTVNQLLFLKKSRPDILRAADCFLSVSDYILFRLTGEKRTEESLACRTMLYDVFRREWESELTAFAGAEGKLPRVTAPKEEWPCLKKEMAQRFGLREEVRVCIGGHDHLCAATAEGLEEGEVLNSCGTSEVYLGFLAQTEKLPLLERLYENGIQLGVFQGRYYWICNMPSSGASIEWLRRFLSWNGERVSYESLMRPSHVIPSSILYFPFINGQGTHRREPVEAGLLGLTMHTTPQDAAQGIYEGIAFETQTILEHLEAAGIRTERIVSAGGGIRNRLLMQAKADVTGREFLLSENTQATAMGAAILAGLPKTEARKADKGTKASVRVSEEAVRPTPDLRKAYLLKYDRWRKLLRTL